MGILFKARGSSSIGIFLIRIIVGAYTLSLGIMQASNIELYISKIKAMNIVSENTAFIAGFVFFMQINIQDKKKSELFESILLSPVT